MAKNLRSKIPASDSLIVHDRNKDATASFIQEVGIAKDSANSNSEMGLMGIEIASSPRAVAEKAVRYLLLIVTQLLPYDEHVPNSMI